MILDWILVVIGTRPSLLVGEDRTAITFSFLMEGNSCPIAVCFQKRQIAVLEGPFEEKPAWQIRGLWKCFCCLTVICWFLVQIQWLACVEIKNTKLFLPLCSLIILLHPRCKMSLNQAGLSLGPQHCVWKYTSRVLKLVQTVHLLCVLSHGKTRSFLVF